MKVRRKRFTIMRSAAIAGCLAGLAVPSVAGAMPIVGDPILGGHTVAVHHAIGADTLSSQSKSPVAKPSGIGADTLSSQSKAPSSSPSYVREVRTVNDSDQTLAIALAAAALGIALCGAGYALTRVASIQRRLIGTTS
jgi:hypothetical protein